MINIKNFCALSKSVRIKPTAGQTIPPSTPCRYRAVASSRIREYGCRLAAATASAVMDLALPKLCAPTRSTADVAFARQIAMYLSHTKFGISYSDVGLYFNRDRSTVIHACHLVEDRRDGADFDARLERMEYLIDAAIPELSVSRHHQQHLIVGEAN